MRAWATPLAASIAAVVAVVLSLTGDPEGWVGVPLFFGALLAVMVIGGRYRWRGAATAAIVPAAFVLLFPEGGPDAPADQGGCDPFCADPVRGIGDAAWAGAFGLTLALIGWLAALAISRIAKPHLPAGLS